MSDGYVRKLSDRNLKRWRQEFPFLTKHPDSLSLQAYCTLCKQSLTPKINVIRHHSETRAHKVLEKCAQDSELESAETDDKGDDNFDAPRVEEVQVVTHAVVAEDGLIIENYTTIDKLALQEADQDEDLEDVTGFSDLLGNNEQSSVTNMESDVGKSYTKISANAQYPYFIEKEIQRRFFTMQGYDALWKCNGGIFKMHKFVVSLYSSYLRELLEASVDDEDCMIHTPDLSSLIVKSFLCLCYTGRVVLPSEELTQSVIKVFNELGCKGQFDVEKKKIKRLKDADIVDSVQGKKRKLTTEKTKKTERRRKNIRKEVAELKKELNDSGESPLEVTQVVIVQDNLMDNVYENETSLVYEYEQPDNDDDEWKPDKKDADSDLDFDFVPVQDRNKDKEGEKEGRIKLEMEDCFQDEDLLGTSEEYSNLMLPQDEDKENRLDWGTVTPDKKKLQKERSRDSANKYYMVGSYNGFHKGQLSASLKEDLLDNPPEEAITSLHVCHLCYQVFPFIDAFNLHMDEKHGDKKPRYGRFYARDNTYRCPTCNEDITVIHLIWFVKHLKYCGEDQVKANQLLRPGDTDVPVSKDEVKDLYSEDMMTGKPENKGYQSLCDLLLGRMHPALYGCRTCYEVFPEKEELIHHYSTIHGGKVEYGSCYDEKSKLYTCSYCNLVMKKTHLLHFIRHIKQCLVDPSLAYMRYHEEEGMEDDETQDTIDPWGIINRPLRVSNLRSEWICESLFGRFYPILFPCHICYAVFKQEQEIKQHFNESHVNVENCVENGSMYDKDKDCYNCPLCHKDVCRNQKSSIYFTYHMKKCAGETLEVTKTCDKCNKTFNKYNTYTNHQLYFCTENGNNGFICHICSAVIKTKRELDTHVKYVHTNIRQFECEQCHKKFKRKGDLVVHMQTHTETPGFFCDKCGKSFYKKRNLKSHMSTHDTSDASKRHACFECGRRFLRLQALKNHHTTHSNERLYSCEVCGARVKTPGTLMTHRKKVHKLHTPPPKMSLQPGSTLLDKVTATTTLLDKVTTTTTLLETAEIQHAPNEGAAILLIKTEKLGGGPDSDMPHLL